MDIKGCSWLLPIAIMTTKALEPGSMQKVRSTVINSFTRYVCSEDLTVKYMHDQMRGDGSGAVLLAVMDHFALYLFFRVGDSGKRLQKSTVAAYFGHIKVWLLSTHSGLRAET